MKLLRRELGAGSGFGTLSRSGIVSMPGSETAIVSRAEFGSGRRAAVNDVALNDTGNCNCNKKQQLYEAA